MTPAVRELPSDLVLFSGAHSDGSKEMCALEAVAWIAGEPWSDHPNCACPVISNFIRSWNDGITDDAERTRLIGPLVPQIVDTKSTAEVELARVMLVIDWFCREHLPAWLELSPSLQGHASTLRAAKPIQSWGDFDAIVAAISAAQKDTDAARAAAWDAARAAAWDAAWDAARAAAWGAARAAAWGAAWGAAWDAARAAARAAAWGAAWGAARAAAWGAARDAAWDAARDAAWAALMPTKEKLQLSAVRLVERMIAVK